MAPLLILVLVLSIAQRVDAETVSAAGAGAPAVSTERRWRIVDPSGRPVFASAVAAYGSDLFLLQPASLWHIPGGRKLLRSPATLAAVPLAPPAGKVGGVPVQELVSMAPCPARGSVVVLDKSGDIYEYWPGRKQWGLLRRNRSLGSQPDPDFVDIACAGSRVMALDPERNRIWLFPPVANEPEALFEEILPWKLKPGEPSVADGLAIAFDGQACVLKRSGRIASYTMPSPESPCLQSLVAFKRPAGMRPSRIASGPGTPFYVVERENNRILAIDRSSGRCRQFLFGPGSDLRGLLPAAGGFWVLDGAELVGKALADADAPSRPAHPRRIDSRLDGLVIPIQGARLPRHPGVWPGARRLYRYGVHKGVDFFNDPGCAARIAMGTPVRAADGGKVTRADVHFRDMDAQTYARVMTQCRREHVTSDENEDLFRGCQVWLDHGNGLVTKYAHLEAVREGLAVGTFVKPGEVIGFVGVSGTGQNLPGRTKRPHLHFEIWLDGKYLGWGLTAGETIGVYEDIFGTACERGGS